MVPLFPLHFWQQRLLLKAPPSIGILLSALIVTMGLYGVIRLIVPFGYMMLITVREFLLYALLAGGSLLLVLSARNHEIRQWMPALSMSFMSLITAGLLVPSAMVLEGVLYLMALNGFCLSLGWLFLGRYPRKHDETPASKLTCYLILPASILLPVALSVPGLLRLFGGMFTFQMAGGFAGVVLTSAIFLVLSWKMFLFIVLKRSSQNQNQALYDN
jgi:NADH-quinone oxidoreductase subunit M